MDIQEIKSKFKVYREYQRKREEALNEIYPHIQTVANQVALSDGWKLDREYFVSEITEREITVSFYYYGEDETLSFPTEFLWSPDLATDLAERRRQKEEKERQKKLKREAEELERGRKLYESLKEKYGDKE